MSFIEKNKQLNTNKEDVLNKVVTEDKISRYYELQRQAKELEKEMSKLKKEFHHYFDLRDGEYSKSEKTTEHYALQRQIRVSKQYDDQKTIQLLKELSLEDCIQVLERPDQEKIDAAVTLGLIEKESLEQCIQMKHSQAIVVRKI